jgi:hypothetical protein
LDAVELEGEKALKVNSYDLEFDLASVNLQMTTLSRNAFYKIPTSRQ